MTLGEKIKHERKKRKLTQSDLAGNRITRNMISLIEKDSANPSFETLKYIAERLSLPLSYLISETDDAFYFAKKDAFDGIKAAYIAKNYAVVISRIEKLEKADDELSLLLAESHLQLGRRFLMSGSLISATKHLEKAISISEDTCYNTDRLKALANLYLAVSKNMQSPLLDLDQDSYKNTLVSEFDVDFYKYLTFDAEHDFKNLNYKKHLLAKTLIKDRKYEEAIGILLEIDVTLRKSDYNAYAIFSIYSDLETCYKHLCDYENAYKYSSKRMSLIEGFKS